jgi:hypothetical protein
MQHNAQQLWIEASDCGLRITGLDGWTQTRLAQTLQIRRETLNAIINRSPGSEPTEARPRMVEACRRLIAFAAALSAKEDAILKLPIDAGNLQSDDGQAYEHHRLRLHQLVEQAGASGRFTDALCRIGEFASAALYAAPRFRLRMVCNLVTAIQRLLDKPQSRDVAAAVLRANLARLYRAERSARALARRRRGDTDALEQVTYVRGQVGYGLIYSGLLLSIQRLIERGGRRLEAAVAAQPDPSYGHWCNWQRATSDLLGSAWPEIGQMWAARILEAARGQRGDEFARSLRSLESKGEIARLREYWQRSSGGGQKLLKRLVGGESNGRPSGAGNAARRVVVAMIGAALWLTAPEARGGDGRDFRSAQTAGQPSQPQPQTPAPAIATPAKPSVRTQATATPGGGGGGGGASSLTVGAGKPGLIVKNVSGATGAGTALQQGDGRGNAAQGMGIGLRRPDFETGTDDGDLSVAQLDALIDALSTAPSEPSVGSTPEAAWGQSLRSYLREGERTPAHKAEAKKVEEAPRPQPPRAPVPAPAAAPRGPADPAVAAERALQMARNYLTAGHEAMARDKLRKIVQSYPDTSAAEEAAALLKQMAAANGAQAMAQ